MMKRITWGLVIAFPVVAAILLVMPAPLPWQTFLALPMIGLALLFVAEQRLLRFVGLALTVVGIWIVIMVVQDDAKRHQHALRAIWEKERHQPRQAPAFGTPFS